VAARATWRRGTCPAGLVDGHGDWRSRGRGRGRWLLWCGGTAAWVSVPSVGKTKAPALSAVVLQPWAPASRRWSGFVSGPAFATQRQGAGNATYSVALVSVPWRWWAYNDVVRALFCSRGTMRASCARFRSYGQWCLKRALDARHCDPVPHGRKRLEAPCIAVFRILTDISALMADPYMPSLSIE